MAWPCVTRACCIARFGNHQDKGDIAVPLMFSKYSEVTDGAPNPHLQQTQPRPRSATIETHPSLSDSYYGGQNRLSRDYSKQLETAKASVMQQDYKPWKSSPEPSCKPKIEYQPTEAPLERETQYKKDFRSWPIPRQGDHPWIPKPIPGPTPQIITIEDRKKREVLQPSIQPPAEKKILSTDQGESSDTKSMKVKAPVAFNVTSEILLAVVEEKQNREKFLARLPSSDALKTRDTVASLQSQITDEGGSGTSYRNEFKPWTDIKPVKPIKAKSQYKPPEDKVSHETSYKATYKGEINLPTAGDNKLTERRRIRSLYSEPHKESSKVEKPSVQTSKPKKITASHKPLKKAKDKTTVPGRVSKKKGPETTTPTASTKPEDKEKSKEMNNKLAEAKE
ncbi:microtubule-associated protein 6 isoform X1 [Bombina bombina]|uniref:microtubule-associated protein 6 isoform X1 n=1 Tax=Bombina bombina TaxID=8345 RepID=UPI00235A7A03|nr:microtubule-associated protein 6 isoform X1 [Bombina bombina]